MNYSRFLFALELAFWRFGFRAEEPYLACVSTGRERILMKNGRVPQVCTQVTSPLQCVCGPHSCTRMRPLSPTLLASVIYCIRNALM